ncbi:PD-(D/E)XK nuclease domain-containing protein [Segatella copri]|uniref:PD-(D/E)XK nuclease domain-containing protein n=1 Tax=Segatella copri TaxID=165179 RepID=UPI0022300450|nr:PD-(D/E)XK nuclease domain-containing protein [Segatella copri]MCW4135144.1 PD-(D/E)XK nuclease domain-containing protein [Segatella copri]
MRCSFFELLSRYLSNCYTFAIEQNLPSGRADLVLTGIPGTSFHNDCRIIEFKYFKSKDTGIVDHLEEARLEDGKQVKAYAADMQKAYPHYQIKAYVAYIAGNKACKIFKENSND